MATRDHIDFDNLTITGAHGLVEEPATGVTVEDDVIVIVTQAYGPDGDSLVGISDVEFDGYPAVVVKVRADGKEGLVHLSPFHGDRRKKTDLELDPGTRCELICPVSDKPLDFVGAVGTESGARYYAIYLTPKLSEGEMVMVSDIWGDYHSRIVDNFDLISMWAVDSE